MHDARCKFADESPKLTLSEVACGADERPISFGDTSIMFIRLTFANADDDFGQNGICHFDISQEQRALNLRVPKLHSQFKIKRTIPCSSRLLKRFRSKV